MVAYGFVYACVHYICACCMLGLHGFMVGMFPISVQPVVACVHGY